MEKLSVLNYVMKNYYEPEVPTLLNNNLTLFPELKKTKEFIQDTKIIIPMQIAVNERGVGPRPELGTLPVPSDSEYGQAYENMKYLYATMYISGPTIELTKSKDTLVNALERAFKGTLSAFYLDWEMQVWGDATGQIGAVTAVVGNLLTVTNIHFFRKGMYLVAYTPGAVAHTNGVNLYYKVTDVNYITSKITVDDATNCVVTDLLYREGSVTLVAGPALTYAGMNGLKNVISNSNTFENVNRALASEWQALIVQGATPGTPETMTSLGIMAALDAQATRLGEEYLPNLMLGSYGIRRAYKKMMDDVHVPTEAMPTISGFKQGYKFSYGNKDIPIVASRFGWANNLIGVNTEHLMMSEGYAGKWTKGVEGVLTDDKTVDSFHAKFKMYTQLIADRGDVFLAREDFTEQ